MEPAINYKLEPLGCTAQAHWAAAGAAAPRRRYGRVTILNKSSLSVLTVKKFLVVNNRVGSKLQRTDTVWVL